MKYLFFSVLLSLGMSAFAKTYMTNEGNTSPETFSSKSTDVQQHQRAERTATEPGAFNGSGVRTDQMNTSPNRPPTSEEELIDDTTLTTEKFDPTKPGEIQAQEEEDALDYSTTPEKRTTKPLGPNKK